MVSRSRTFGDSLGTYLKIELPSLCAVFSIMSFVVIGCATTSSEVRGEASVDTSAGEVISVEELYTYSASTVRAFVSMVDGVESISVEHGIQMLRVEYWTQGPSGHFTNASGLLAYPLDTAPRGVVSYQHGTRAARWEGPSAPTPNEGLLAALVFAGHGYILLAPDFIGFGASQELHPYLHAESEANAVINLLKAARAVVENLQITWPEPLFLTGFSQGGHATIAAHRALEASPYPDFRVTASAPVSGVYNLSEITLQFVLEGHAESSSFYLAYLASSVTRIYGEENPPVTSPAYRGKLQPLFSGDLTGDDIKKSLPSDPRHLFTESFLRDVESGDDLWFVQALSESDVYDWTPVAPVKLYFGQRDLDAPPHGAIWAAEWMQRRGGNVTLMDLGEFNHDESILRAVPLVRSWFDSLADAVEGGG